MAETDSTKAPAFQFYPKDYLSDAKTRAMTFKQRGMYWDLVSYCWLEGGLPADPIEVARILGIATPARFVKHDWPVISRCFYQVESGEHQHQRLEVERRKQAENREASRKAGLASGRARRGKANGRSTDVQPIADAPPTKTNSSTASADSSKRESAPSKFAHKGERLAVWHWMHEDLGRRLGGKIDAFDLTGWYARLEAELARTGESFADPWKWLQERLYRDAKLPLPNLMGKAKEPGPGGAAYKRYVPFRERPVTDG